VSYLMGFCWCGWYDELVGMTMSFQNFGRASASNN
jgi:hypothetical protein